ncbi:neuroblast differentiation-associated protein AHNAK-like isoform X7 [Oncorhynchus keta]|uniref:neuroblast differentiation-associated protein AHNAK-like isoform X7 n=1 Tax=Oncorhynchus keta TaxID=8018 RepID=UPI00227C8EA2|nr:neuroblast differentiation-associated protein AHNAK-like isoform X7 [Oncorhynchus keta]
MDSSTDAQAVEETASEEVEVVVETEAEAGASGYSVTGGGERGLFIKDVLKDSTAAKHLSLQQGDQLLSARVYFDNVKYEDALKILQCAEPYKVSFFLKRTITGADVTMHPGTTSMELKGPKTKMQKMSVKSIKPFKAKKKRGGRFGLKRLKENKKGSTGAELEGSPSKVELNPVDVEFAFPKFKLRKDGKAEGTEQHGGVVATGRKKRMIRCPRMNAKGAEVATGEVDMTQPEGQADVSRPDVPGAKAKVKGKGHRFGIHFPKTKKTTSDTALSEGSLELKPPDVKFTPPSVEFSSPSGNKEVTLQKPEVKVKEGSKFMHREVELSLGLPSARPSDEIDGEIKAKGLAEGVEGSTGLPGIKMPAIDISAPNIDLQLDTRSRVPDKIEGPFFKGPNISMPKTDISLPKIGSSDMDIEGPEKGGKMSLPAVDISLPKMTSGEANVDVEGHIGKGGKFKMPTFDVSLPKFKSSEEDMNIEGPEVKGEFNMPKVDLLRPKGKAGGEVDIEGYLGKGGTFQMPTFDNSLPRMKSSDREINVEGPEVKGGKIQMPYADISLPKGKTEGKMNIEGHSGKGGKFKMPSCDVSLSKMLGNASFEGPELKGGKLEMPTLDISLARGKAEGEVNIDSNVGKEGMLKTPTIDIPPPKMRSSGTEVVVKGPDVKGGKFHMPQVDISLPKGKSEIDIEGKPEKRGKIQMSSFDVSLPKIKSAEGDMKIEGSDVKGITFHMPTIDCSLPTGRTEVDISVEGEASKGGKFHMPSLDISPPTVKFPEGKAKVKGPELKGGKVEITNIEVSLPKGKTAGEVNIEGHVSKGGKFKMPKFGISFPKFKSPEGKVNTEGPEVKGGKFHMPKIDISLPKVKMEGDIKVEGDSDISLPKMKSPEADILLEGPDLKGGKFHVPTIDLSLPKGKGAIDTEEHSGKGGKFQMPAFDISLPKMKTPDGEVSLEGPEVKGGNIDMPTMNISLPKGKMEGEIDIEEHSGKGGRFHMPTFNVSLPKRKSLEEYVSLEGPSVKGGKFHMPTMDYSLPKGKGEIETEGHSGKGGKFHTPEFDVSLPKMKLPEWDIKLEGPEGKGSKIHMPNIDISLPEGKTERDIQVEGHGGKGGKFHMPSIDISLPKMKLPEGEVKVEGPKAKGGKIEMPKINISLPKGKTEGEIDTEGHSEKKGKFHMPTIDMSLPKMKSKDGEIKLEGPEVTGSKIHMPNIDISLPKVKAESDIEVEGYGGKGRKFHMPSLDISLPKMKLPEGEDKLEGLEAKGGKFEMPKIDISLPKGKAEGETDIEGHSGKGGKFKMPKFDVSLPKMKHPEGDVKEGLEVKGGKFEMPKIEAEGRSGVKLPTVKLPTVDISAPKVDLDFGLSKAKGDDREEMELLKAEGGRPSSGSSFDMPDVSLKMPRFSLPKFGRKSSGNVNLEGYGKEDDIDISPPRVDGEGRPASVEIGGDGKIKGKLRKPKMKMPTFGISKKDVSIASPDVEIKTEKGKVDIPTPGISVENPADKTNRKYRLKFPKFKKSSPKGKLPEGEIDASLDSGMEGKAGFHAPDVTIKMPKFSMPGFGSKETDFDRSGKSAELEAKGKVKMPSVEISLQAAKTSEQEMLIPDVSEADISGYEGNLKIPKMPTIDVSAPHIDLDVTLPKVKHETNIDGEGGKFKMANIKMPDIDVSHPIGKTGDIDASKVKLEGGGGKFKMPGIKMPKVDISLPKVKHGEIDVSTVEIEGEGGKFKKPHMEMPNFDISLPKGKSGGIEGPKMEIEGGGGNFKMPHMKMPKVDFSLPKGNHGDISAPEMEGEGGKFKMPYMKMPNIDISLPKGKIGDIEGPEMKIEGGDGKCKIPHMKMPNVDISLPKGKSGDVNAPVLEIEGEGGRYKMPEIKLPNIDITLPKGKSADINAEIKKPNAEAAAKIQMPSIGLPKYTTPDLDLDMNVGKPNHGAEVHENSSDKTGSHSKGDHKMKIKMPTIDIECPKGDLELDIGFHKVEGKKDIKIIELPDLDLKTSGTKVKGPKVKGTKFKIGMPKMKNTGDQALDAATKKTEKENEGVSGRFMIKRTKLGKGADVEADAGAGVSVLPNISLPDVGFSVSKGASQEGEPHGPEISAKLPKFKLPNVELLGPSVAGEGGAQINSGQQEDKGGIKFQMPVGLKSKQGPAESTGTDASTENGFTLPHLGIKSPKIPDTDFDIGASQTGDHGADTSTRQKMKIPKFGVALPAISSPGARVHLKDPDVECEGPKMPKVKKAVFVLVNPQTDHSTMSTSVESGEANIKMPKIKMKPSFGKSGSKENSAALSIEGDVDGDDKSKGAKLKMPKVTFSPVKTGSFDVTLKGEGSSSSLNGEKDPTFQNESKEDKVKLGKLKLPKIEFSSPYSIIGSGEEDLEMSAKLVNESSGTDRETKGTKVKLGKMSFPGFKKKTAKGEEETQDNVVSSSARTEMLNWDSSESQTPMVSIGFVPGKSRGQAVAESSKKEMEEGEQSTWFKAPKFNLKPHSTGILHITPEGSPQGSRSSLQCQGLDETAGTFRLQMPSMRFSTHEVSEENVTTTKKGTVTVVTKTTKHTVTESRTGQTHTSLSHCND